jgi:hypothetical protein
VLTRLTAGLAFAELRVANAEELQQSAPKQRVSPR